MTNVLLSFQLSVYTSVVLILVFYMQNATVGLNTFTQTLNLLPTLIL